MIFVPVILSFALVAIVYLFIWTIVSNNITYSQRKKIIYLAYEAHNISYSSGLLVAPVRDAFLCVSYSEHHFYVLTFRNPYDLYSHPDIKALGTAD